MRLPLPLTFEGLVASDTFQNLLLNVFLVTLVAFGEFLGILDLRPLWNFGCRRLGRSCGGETGEFRQTVAAGQLSRSRLTHFGDRVQEGTHLLVTNLTRAADLSRKRLDNSC